MNCQCFNIFLTIKGVVALQLDVSSSGASVKVPITPVKSKSVDGFNVMSVEDAEFETSPDDIKVDANDDTSPPEVCD